MDVFDQSTRLTFLKGYTKAALELEGTGDPETDSATEWSEQPTRVSGFYDKYHRDQYNKTRDIAPQDEGTLSDQERMRGLARTRLDHPELFDPNAREMMKDWKDAYKKPYESLSREGKIQRLMSYSNTPKLEESLAAELTEILNQTVGKQVKIFVGSPIMPKIETVKIFDVDPRLQTIVFQVMDGNRKYETSYDDFFYHQKVGGSDAKRSGIRFPDKEGFLSKVWQKVLGLVNPRAKV